jgi:long-chain acyl-CoA synthetase
MNYRSLSEVHRRQADRFGPRAALRYKRNGLYHDVNWTDYRNTALACAAALVDAGIKPGDRVGLLAENCLEWLFADMGILTAAAINVSPHAPLTARQVQFQFDDAGVTWAFVSNSEQLEKLRQVRGELPRLRGIVVFESGAVTERDSKANVMPWSVFLRRGRDRVAELARELARREENTAPHDLATIMYTSGTTGNPKGVMLTHHNLVSNACASLEVSPIRIGDVVLSWLPLSHIYARLVDHYQNLVGGAVVCLAESAETLVENLAEIQPTHMAAVPRFYEKVLTAVSSPDAEKTRSRLRAIFGPRIFWLSAGGAPLPPAIAEVFCDAGLPLYQGYGLTETSPVISFNRPGQNKVGTVGLPLPGIEVKIAPDGEVLTRGPHVMKGYWNNPEATAETIRDGWLYTGDLGQIDSEGYLSITGRKKELMVLSNGKKVVPPFIEGLLLADDCIDQAVICGEGRNFLTALIVPHWQNVRTALSQSGVELNHQPEEELAQHPAVRDLIQKRVQKALADVSNWEQLKKFIILPKPFTVAAEELTVSLKLRRNVVLNKYRDMLSALYKEDGATSACQP